MSEENPPVGDATDAPKGSATDPSPPSLVDDSGAPKDDSGVPKVYNETYVTKLREEAAAYRVKAKLADEAKRRLQEGMIEIYSAGVLTDPTDLDWSDDYADAEGWPDPEKISAAAADLVNRKPHLGRPSGDVGQGRHSEQDDSVSLVGLLRSGA